MPPVNPVTNRIVGAFALCLGAALATFAALIAVRQLGHLGTVRAGAAVLVVIVVLLSAFFLRLGYRLVLLRPNRFLSLLSPWEWRGLGTVLGVLALGWIGLCLWSGQYRWAPGVVGLVVLAYGCLVAGRQSALRSLEPTVFSPEVSLLDVEDLVPADFRFGVEILNDDATPMEFVVDMLESELGLDRPAAIERMLEIHTRGGVLFPTASPERADEIAGRITAEAGSRGHPLVCRAVTRER